MAEISSYERDRGVVASVKRMVEEAREVTGKFYGLDAGKERAKKAVELKPDELTRVNREREECRGAIAKARKLLERLDVSPGVHEAFAREYCQRLEKVYGMFFADRKAGYARELKELKEEYGNFSREVDKLKKDMEADRCWEERLEREEREAVGRANKAVQEATKFTERWEKLEEKRGKMWDDFCRRLPGYALRVQLRRFPNGELRFMIEREKFRARLYLFFHRKAVEKREKEYLEVYRELDDCKEKSGKWQKECTSRNVALRNKRQERAKLTGQLSRDRERLKEGEEKMKRYTRRIGELANGSFWVETEKCSPAFIREHGLELPDDYWTLFYKGLKQAGGAYPRDLIALPQDERDTYVREVSAEALVERLSGIQQMRIKEQQDIVNRFMGRMAELEGRLKVVDGRKADIDKEYEDKEQACIGTYFRIVDRLLDLGKKHPLLLPCKGGAEEWERGKVAGQMERLAGETTAVPYLVTGWRMEKGLLDDDVWVLPEFTRWQDPAGGRCNFVVEYKAREEERAFRFMNHLLLNMVLSLPPKRLEFAFVDLNMSNAASFFTINFDGRLCHGGPITTEEKFRRYLEQLQDRIMTDVFKRCDNLVKHNVEHRAMMSHYEVIVLFDYPESYSPAVMKLLRPLCQNGYKAGVFFVVMHPGGTAVPAGQSVDITEMETFTRLSIPEMDKERMPHGLQVDFNYILNDGELTRECIRRVNEGLEREDAISTIYQDTTALVTRPYEDAGEEFRVAVGETNGRVQWFRLDEVEHVHGFVLGKSGSGKSVFLHDVIANAILQYSPESLQLYLLDFKLGGVEFNRYRDVKHVRALLVDNSDRQIVLEILRDIYTRMKRRGELMREAGASNLKEYNRMHPERRFARVVLVVDECHELFQERVDKVQAEINRIVMKISKEGRNQGVHFIFATQTLPASGNISPDILKNVTDYYLLKSAPTDADRLVRDSGRQVAQLSTGWLLYSNSTTSEVFQAYFRDKDRLEGEIAEATRKSAGFPDEGRFFFSGKQTFAVDAALPGELKAVSGEGLVAMPGRNINVGLKPVGFPLRAEVRENVLLFGVNNREQCSRVTLNVLLTLMVSARVNGLPCRFRVLNGFKDAGRRVHAARFLAMLEGAGCEVVDRACWGEFLMSVLIDVREGRAERQVIVMLGQENFRELEWNEEIVVGQESRESVSAPEPERVSHLGDMEVPEFLRGLDAPLPRLSAERKPARGTFRDVVGELLKRGPEAGVHVVLEVDTLSKLLFEEVVTPQRVYALFNHVVMLRSPEEVNHKLRLPEEVRLDMLSDEQDMLRAYYHNHAEDTYTLFTPYVYPEAEVVKDLLDK